jgi:hypothetical protein
MLFLHALLICMQQYGAKFIFQGMPRLLTLWFEIGALQDTSSSSTSIAEAAAPAAAGRSRGTSAKAAAAAAQAAAQAATAAAAAAKARVASSSVQQLITRATHLVQRAVASVPAYMWYTCLPQLMSRLGHPSEEASSTA